jgi:hypothetical protein
MRTSAFFWGIILSLGGVILLLDNLDLLGGVQGWQILGPSLLILLGLWIVLSRSFRRKSPTEAVSVALDGAEKARLHINHAAGRLVVESGASAGNLVDGDCVGGVEISTKRRGEVLEARLSVLSRFFPMDWPVSIEWKLRLSASIPLSIEFNTGAGRNKLDLEQLQVNEIVLKTGASSTNLILPKHPGDGIVKIEAGVASVDIQVPEGVAVRVRSRGGLATVNVDSQAFPRHGEFHESPDFDSAHDRCTIDVSTGVGTISVRKL